MATTLAGNFSRLCGWNWRCRTVQYANGHCSRRRQEIFLFATAITKNRIRKITPAGLVTTFAGSGTPGFNEQVPVQPHNSICPTGFAIGQTINIYVADRFNSGRSGRSPRRVLPDGGSPGFADSTGTAAQFNELYGIAIDGSGNIIVPHVFLIYRIRKVTRRAWLPRWQELDHPVSPMASQYSHFFFQSRLGSRGYKLAMCM